MKRRTMALALAALLTGIACEGDPQRASPPPTPIGPKDLSERWHVVHNMEYACNNRNIAVYTEILDGSFTFYFAPADVAGGAPEKWGRADEVLTVSRIFSRFSEDFPLVRSIEMDIKVDSLTVWTYFVPETAPEEVWYMTTLFYDLSMQIEPDLDLVTVPGTKAQFTVRNAGSDEAPSWRLVEMRDLGAPVPFDARITMSTEKTTWGAAKALFAGLPSP